MVRSASGSRPVVASLLTAVPTGVIGSICAYLSVLTIAAVRATRRGATRRERRSAPTTMFAVIVPAHDEEQLIGATVAGLEAQRYPRELYTTHVVADHCTDRTVDIARSAGATVHEHVDRDRSGKGAALRWAFDEIASGPSVPDAIVIVDADTVADPELLAAFDARLARGADALQAYYAVLDPGTSALIGLRAAALAVRHYLRPLGRTSIGGSCGLFGNGMCLRTSVLRRLPISDHLTEDLESSLDLLLADLTVGFVPDATVEAEMPATFEASRSQHERWEAGRIDLARAYVPVLLRSARAVRGRSRVARLDAAADLMVPPFSVLVAATTLTSMLTMGRARRRPNRLDTCAAVLAAGNLVALAVHVLAALVMVRAPASVYRSLVAAPALVGWKVALWLGVLIRPGRAAWRRTVRNDASATDR